MTSKRKSSSVEYKKENVEDSRGASLVAFYKEKMLNFHLVRLWHADYDNLRQLMDQEN